MAANKPVTTANRPQPSDPQNPQGRSSARTSRRGARADSGLACGRPKVATIVDMAVNPRLNVTRICGAVRQRKTGRYTSAFTRVWTRYGKRVTDQAARIDSPMTSIATKSATTTKLRMRPSTG